MALLQEHLCITKIRLPIMDRRRFLTGIGAGALALSADQLTASAEHYRFTPAPRQTLSRAELELLRRDGRLFLSGLKTLQIERGPNWKAYRELYDYCVIAEPSSESVSVLEDPIDGMPWMSKVWRVPPAGPRPQREVGIVLWDELVWNENDAEQAAYIRDRQNEIRECRSRHPQSLLPITSYQFPEIPSARRL